MKLFDNLRSFSVSHSGWLTDWLYDLSVGWLIVCRQIRPHWKAAAVNTSDKLKINSTHAQTHTHTSRPKLDNDDVLCAKTVHLV